MSDNPDPNRKENPPGTPQASTSDPGPGAGVELDAAARAAREKEEQERLDEAKRLEEARKIHQGGTSNGGSVGIPGVRELTSTEKQSRALKELKAIIDKHRRAYKRGKLAWRISSLVLLHLMIISSASAFFVSQSKVLNAPTPPWPTGYRDDLLLGLVLLAIVLLLLLLEHLRNWRKHKYTLTRLDKLIVEITKSEPNLSTSYTQLERILDNHTESFLGNIKTVGSQ